MISIVKNIKPFVLGIILCLGMGCATKKHEAFSESENIETPNNDDSGDTIKKYSGTFHLKATLNEKESQCGADEETQAKFFEELKTIKDVLDCEQANESFQCKSVQHSGLLLVGNIKKTSFELKMDNKPLPYVKTVDYGKDAKIVTILKGSFYTVDLVREATMTYVNQLIKDNVISSSKTCTFKWDVELFRDKNDVSSSKPPVIKSIKMEQKEKTIEVTSEVTDEDSGEKVDVFTIYFEKEKAPEQKDIDWTKASKGKSGAPYSITGVENGKTYIVYVKAVDEGGNQVISSKEHTFKLPTVGNGVNGTPVGTESGTQGNGTEGRADTDGVTVIQITEIDTDALQDFSKELCDTNSEVMDKHAELKKLCDFVFTIENPKFTFNGATGSNQLITVSISDFTVSGFGLISIPESISTLINLQSIFISPSEIAQLPKSIVKLKKLKELRLAGAKLKALPKDIGNLTDLEKINLTSNELKTLPTSIDKLKKLKELNLTGNPLTNAEKKRLKTLFGDKVIF